MAKDAKVFALQTLRNQINQRVYPTHRLDRKTSGVLLFAKSEEYNKLIQAKFRNNEIRKEYKAIVRGYTPKELTIDYALKNDEKVQEALTQLETLEHFEVNLASNNFSTSRYSLVRLTPQTGRFHQLRKHMAHIFHPIIGDRPHGCNKQNRLWKHTVSIEEMLLCATKLELELNGESLIISTETSDAFQKAHTYLKNEAV